MPTTLTDTAPKRGDVIYFCGACSLSKTDMLGCTYVLLNEIKFSEMKNTTVCEFDDEKLRCVFYL